MASTSLPESESPMPTLADVIPAISSSQAFKLDLATIQALRLSCKQVRDAVNPLFCKIEVSPSCVEELQTKPSLTRNIRTLKLVADLPEYVDYRSKYRDFSESDVLKLYHDVDLPMLESLELQIQGDGDCLALLRALAQCTDWPHLKSLEVSFENDKSEISYEEFEAFEGTKWPLESLQISSSSGSGRFEGAVVEWMLPYLPGLKELKLSHLRGYDMEDLTYSWLSNLEKLTIGEVYDVFSDVEAARVLCGAAFPKLHTFNYTYSRRSIDTLDAFASAPWIKNLESLTLANEPTFWYIPTGMSSAIVASLLQALHQSKSLKHLFLQFEVAGLNALETVSLPALNKLELSLTGKPQVDSEDDDVSLETISLDEPMKGFFKAHMPSLTSLSILPGEWCPYEWRMPPSLLPNSSAFPLKYLKIMHTSTSEDPDEIAISPEVFMFLSRAFVCNGLQSVILMGVKCYDIDRRRVHDLLGLLLSGVADDNSCELRYLTMPVGGLTLINLPLYLKKMRHLKWFKFYDQMSPEHDGHVTLIGRMKIYSKSAFVLQLGLGLRSIQAFEMVASRFDVIAMSRSERPMFKVLEELYPEAEITSSWELHQKYPL